MTLLNNTVELLVTEGKSVGNGPNCQGMVRVFLDQDLNYGYFVGEGELFALLSAQQQAAYLQGSQVSLQVTREVGQKIIDLGVSPYEKAKLL